MFSKWSLVQSIVLGACLALVGQPRALAQCPDPHWQPGEGIAGADAVVFATTQWDTDGPGPLAPVLAVGGQFTAAGHVSANSVAIWTGSTWYALDSGVPAPGRVNALVGSPGGPLYVGGDFTNVGGQSIAGLAQWDGHLWSPVGTGLAGIINALVISSAGDLIVGGQFTIAGVPGANNIARWDGTQWHAFASGVNGPVRCMGFSQNSVLFIGGAFSSAGADPRTNIAQWDGSSWQDVGGGVDGNVQTLAVMTDGSVAIAGFFSNAGGAPASKVARWSGSAWIPMGASISSGDINALYQHSNGQLYAAGSFSNFSAYRLGVWTGTTWASIGPNVYSGTPARTLGEFAGSLIVAGDFSSVNISGGTSRFNRIVRYNNGWSGFFSRPGNISSVTRLPDGDLILAGSFTFPPGSTTNRRIVRFGPAGFTGFGTGMNNRVTATAVAPNGTVAAAGAFTQAGGQPAPKLAVWNGTAWSAPASTFVYDTDLYSELAIYAVGFDPDSNLVISGNFTEIDGVSCPNLARKRNGVWEPMGIPPNDNIWTFARSTAGDLYAGGAFTSLGGIAAFRIARWTGTAWAAVGSGVASDVRAIAFGPNNEIVVAGGTTTAGLLARWNGTSWLNYGSVSDYNTAVDVSPTGRIVFSGRIDSFGLISTIAFQDGPVYSQLSNSVRGGFTGMLFRPNNDLLLIGASATDSVTSSSGMTTWASSATPDISQQPALTKRCDGAEVTVRASSSLPLTYQWQFESASGVWAPITDTSQPISCGGAIFIDGPADRARVRFRLTGCAGLPTVAVRCALTTTCGSTTSTSLVISSCIADFDCSGAVLPADIFEFLNAWFGSDPRADINGSGLAPSDIFDFLNAWFAGC